MLLLGFPGLPDLLELPGFPSFASPIRPLHQIRSNSVPSETANMKLTTIILGALALSMSALAHIRFHRASRLIPHPALRHMTRQAPTKALATGNDIWRRTSRTIPRTNRPEVRSSAA